MSVAISLSEAPSPAVNAAHGVGQVAYGAGADGESRLRDLYQSDPVRILFPTPPRGEIPAAAFVTTSGGLVGGDRLELSASAEPGAALQCYPQSAEKVYRSNGAECHIDVALQADEGAWLEWLPREAILFDGARLIRRTAAHVAPGGRLLAGEISVLGRGAMGESIRYGLLREDWHVYRGDRLVWSDSLRLENDIAETRSHRAGLAGATALATATYIADDAADFLTPARTLLAGAPPLVRTGATIVNDILVVRLLAADPQLLHRAFGEFWAGFRHDAAGLSAVLPRLWHI